MSTWENYLETLIQKGLVIEALETVEEAGRIAGHTQDQFFRDIFSIMLTMMLSNK